MVDEEKAAEEKTRSRRIQDTRPNNKTNIKWKKNKLKLSRQEEIVAEKGRKRQKKAPEVQQQQIKILLDRIKVHEVD